jgi:hypothetical protein
MEGVMFLITRAEWARMNVLTALGSLVTMARENAFRVGAFVHATAGVGFALLYNFAMKGFGLAALPAAFFVGIAFGIIHGMIVSPIVVWVVCERHPLEEFREAGFAVGLAHFAGHVAYGAVVGLVIGIGPAVQWPVLPAGDCPYSPIILTSTRLRRMPSNSP